MPTSPFDLDNIRQRDWIRLLRRTGLGQRPLYPCRHTYATLLLSAGETMRFLAPRWDNAMLIRHYVRWSRRSPRRRQRDQRGAGDLRLVKMSDLPENVTGRAGPVRRSKNPLIFYEKYWSG